MDVRVGLWRKLSADKWCFWTVVLEKTLESPLDCKEIQPVHPMGDQSLVFFGRSGAEAKTLNTLATWCDELTHGKDPDSGRDWGQEEKGMTEDEMAGWRHWLDGHEFEWTLGVCDREAWRAAIHGVTTIQTWLSDWTELNPHFHSFKMAYLFTSPSTLHEVYRKKRFQLCSKWKVGVKSSSGKEWRVNLMWEEN